MDQLKSLRESVQNMDDDYPEYPDDFSIDNSMIYTDKNQLFHSVNPNPTYNISQQH